MLAATLLLDDTVEGAALSTPRLARAVGLSAGQLARRFRSEAGVTVTTYRRRRQLQRYLDLCDDDHDISITDAAFSAGFGSYAQFHRVFAREMGMSPSEHRSRRRSAPA